MIAFVKMALLFTEATLLEELEFHNIGRCDFDYMPLGLKGKIQMNRLTKLKLAKTFSNDFIQDLVQANPYLWKLAVRNVNQDFELQSNENLE